MKKIFVRLSPVNFNIVTIFEENQSSSTLQVENKYLKSTIFNNSDIEEIVLIGNKNYTQKFLQEFQEYEKTKYREKKNNIKYTLTEKF